MAKIIAIEEYRKRTHKEPEVVPQKEDDDLFMKLFKSLLMVQEKHK